MAKAVKVSVSIDEELLTKIEARTDRYMDGNRSMAIVGAVSDYWSLLDLGLSLARKSVTENEAWLILDVLNGAWTPGRPGGQDAAWWARDALVWAVSEALELEPYAQKWGVNGDEFVAKIRGLDGLARLALAEWAGRMWARHGAGAAEEWQDECKKFLPNEEG